MTHETILDLAKMFGGRLDGSSILVPAERLSQFLATAKELSVQVPYIDCLFFRSDTVTPSMALSGAPSEFSAFDEFAKFAHQSAQAAVSEAVRTHAEAYFEVGCI